MLTYYYDLMSQPSRAVYIFLKVNNIPFVEVPVALRQGEHLRGEFAKVNPFKQVPVIEDDGFILNESVAILGYLADKYRVVPHWYPADARARAKINAYLNWQHLNIRLGEARLFQTLVIEPLILNKPIDEKAAILYRKLLSKALDQMEEIFLKDTPFIYAQQISIADLLAICEIMQAVALNEVNPSDVNRPKLSQWMHRVQKSVGEPLFTDVHKFINNLGQKYLANRTSGSKL